MIDKSSDLSLLIRSALLKINKITETRSDYEPFLDELQRQWPAVRKALSRVLILLARHQLQNNLLLRMVDYYERAIAVPNYEIAFRDRLTWPAGAMPPNQFIHGCLAFATTLDPKNMYAAFLMGMSYEESGDLAAAAEWFKKSTALEGYHAGVGHWYAARMLEKLGDREAASSAYAEAERTNAHWRQIELLDLARFRGASGDLQASLKAFGTAAEYNWQHFVELFFDLPPAPQSMHELEVEPPQPCEPEAPIVDPLGRPCALYRWDGRYYAVPKSLRRINAVDLTAQGMYRPGFRGWRQATLERFARLPRLYRLIEPLVALLAPRLHRQFDRTLIRSAETPAALAHGDGRPGLSMRIVGFIDRRGRRFRIYQAPGLYIAVPLQLRTFSESDLFASRRPTLRVRTAAALLQRFPILEKIRGFVFRDILRTALEHMLKERIVFAPDLLMLEVRFQQMHGA